MRFLRNGGGMMSRIKKTKPTCAYCSQVMEEPMFTLIRHFTLGKKYEVHFCCYDCLKYDVVDAKKDIK
jgi:hypothetical protein